MTENVDLFNSKPLRVVDLKPIGEDYASNGFFRLPYISEQTYYSTRGAENFHILLWILKDLFWCLDMHVEAIVFGGLALAWCLVLFYKALFPAEDRDALEFYMTVPFSMWLAANFVWMFGK